MDAVTGLMCLFAIGGLVGQLEHFVNYLRCKRRYWKFNRQHGL